jgi:hypothetical protein
MYAMTKTSPIAIAAMETNRICKALASVFSPSRGLAGMEEQFRGETQFPSKLRMVHAIV